MNRIYRVIWSAARQTWSVAPEIGRARGKAASTSKGVVGAIAAAVIAVLPLHTQAATPAPNALPTGGQVVAGQATIAQSGAQMNINQATNQAIINWNTFNIGANATVNFQQPSSSSVTLNRVLDTDPSAIYGRLSANGQVFLINPNGVLFGQGAQVNVGGMVASTLNMRDEDFLSGNYRFTRDGSTGSVVNQGELVGKYIALLAPEVRNEGIITASQGTVALAAGEAVTLNITGNRLIDVQVDPASINTLVENRQLVQADDGTVIMSAQSARQLLGQVVNSGTVEASGISADGGVIRLRASSSIANSGVLRADAGTNGKGGNITLIADLTNPDSLTTVDGTLSAKGGSQSGDGGFIETSGSHLKIADTAHINTSATQGKTGQWLLDPNDFTIAVGGDIDGATLGTALDSNSVIIDTTGGSASCTGVACPGGTAGNGDIIVNDTVSWTSMSTLTLKASRDIKFDALANVSFGDDGMGMPNGARMEIQYGEGGSGKAYAVPGAVFSGFGVIDDISGTRTTGTAVTDALGINPSGGMDYIIGTWNVPLYVQFASGGSNIYGEPYQLSFSLTSGGAPVLVSPITGTPTGSWTGGSGTINAVSYTNLVYAGGLSSPYYSSFAAGSAVNYAVTPRLITLTADNQSKVYGSSLALGTTAFTLTSGTMAFSESITGVTLSSASGYAASTSQGANTYTGNITITGESGAGGFNAANYNITLVAGDLTINKAPLRITANDAVKFIDGRAYSGGNGVTFSGFVNNENKSVLSGDVRYGGDSQGAYNVGKYVIDIETKSTLSSTNYAIRYVNGVLNIISREDTAAKKVADAVAMSANTVDKTVTDWLKGFNTEGKYCFPN